MSSLDYYSKLLNEWKQRRNEDAIKIAELEGVFKAVEQMSKNDPMAVTMTTLGDLIIREVQARKNDVISLLEISLHLMTELAGDINALKSIVASFASEKKVLASRLEEISKRLEQREEILRHLDDFLKEKEQERTELEKYR